MKKETIANVTALNRKPLADKEATMNTEQKLAVRRARYALRKVAREMATNQGLRGAAHASRTKALYTYFISITKGSRKVVATA